MAFKPNRKFKRVYNQIFKEDPFSANLLLLLCELADGDGRVEFAEDDDLVKLIKARFSDPEEYAL